MKIAIPKERRADEARVAASPDTVKKYVGMGFEVVVESGAGEGASLDDSAFAEAGAAIAADEAAALSDADVVLKVARPLTAEEGLDELALMKPGAILISHLAALQNKAQVEAYAKAGISAFALEMLPRITRAQSMDILSSQSNLAGYKSVLDAAAVYGRAFPMMMTAAGTIPPAKVLVLGAGVAGLQAIATAKRLGAIVFAFDVRPAVKEQVESLGGKFVEVDPEAVKDAETKGGYAKEMSEDYKRKQADKIAEVLRQAGPGPHHRGHGQGHAQGLGHRRSGGGSRRQLSAVRVRQGGREAWRYPGGSCQRAVSSGRRRQPAVRQEHFELPDPLLRQGREGPEDQLG